MDEENFSRFVSGLNNDFPCLSPRLETRLEVRRENAAWQNNRWVRRWTVKIERFLATAVALTKHCIIPNAGASRPPSNNKSWKVIYKTV